MKVILPLKNKKNINFSYIKTDEIVKLLESIRKLYNEVNIKPFNLVYEYETLSNCSLDGISSSIPDTLRLLEKGRASKKKENTVLNTLRILKLGLLDEISINSHDIIYLWKELTKKALSNKFLGLNTRGYRKTMVYLKSINNKIAHIPFKPIEIESKMNDLFKYISNGNDNIYIKAIIFHFYFVYVHPFCDGNGRTSRLLLNKILIDSGLEKFRFISITSEVKKNPQKYEESLYACEVNKDCDITEFIKYYLEVINNVLLNLKNNVYIHSIADNVDISVEMKALLDYLKTSHFSMSIKEIYEEFIKMGIKITKQEVLNLINRAEEIGYIQRNKNMKEKRYQYNFNRVS